MRIAFDPSFDLGSWPGPLGRNGDKSAAIGEPWVGPIRLRGHLESALGLSGSILLPLNVSARSQGPSARTRASGANPRKRIPSASPGRFSALQILPLVLAMGWNPPDPRRSVKRDEETSAVYILGW